MNNEYIREYSSGLKLRKKRYLFNEEIKDIKDFILLKEGCLSLLVEFLDGSYSIYFPYVKPSEWKKISQEEAIDLKTRNFKARLNRHDMPLLNKRIENRKYFDIDCSGNLWILSLDNKIYHFLDSKSYQRTRVTRRRLKSDSDKTQWNNLYINCDRPGNTKIKVEVTCGNKSKEYDDCTNIYLYDFIGTSLKVVVTLIRDEDDLKITPTIYSIKSIANRASYVEYLPAYYKEASDFDLETLYRFLAIFQDLMSSFENDIKKSHEILSPALCESEYLDWLSSLLGLRQDFRWEEKRWRDFLEEAPVLYKILGTKECMEKAIELYCDEKPVIDDDIEGKPFEFCVKLSHEKTTNQQDIDVIESIIWAFKPAYTSGRLYIDYSLNENKEYIVGQSVLPFNTEIK